MDYNLIWFILVGILFTGYAILDGFDLGVGGLHLFTKTDEERRTLLNAIGPVWDGNEVWLVTGGGALFAAFPEVYATVFSGFYDAFMLLLFGLLFRAVSIELRSKQSSRIWRKGWDIAFSMGSLLSAFVIGVAMGNIVWGIPLDHNHEFIGSPFHFLNLYSIFLGVTTVALFVMHGNIYLILKTEGELQEKLRRWVKITIPIYGVCFVVFTTITPFVSKHISEAFQQRPLLLLFFFSLSLLLVFNIPREIYKGRDMRAFLSSCSSIATLMILFAVSVFPTMVHSYPNPQNSLTAYNGASTDLTLGIMFIIAIIGIPIVLAYTISVYYIFRGKVEITEESY